MLEHRMEIIGAWDKRSDDPNKNYGIHGCQLQMYVIGPLGAVQFICYTNLHLPSSGKGRNFHVCKGWNNIETYGYFTGDYSDPITSVDLGYHSPKSMYEDQAAMTDCSLIKGGQCFYGGSGLNAEPVLKILVEKGSAGVFEYLENYYRELFEGDE